MTFINKIIMNEYAPHHKRSTLLLTKEIIINHPQLPRDPHRVLQAQQSFTDYRAVPHRLRIATLPQHLVSSTILLPPHCSTNFLFQESIAPHLAVSQSAIALKQVFIIPLFRHLFLASILHHRDHLAHCFNLYLNLDLSLDIQLNLDLSLALVRRLHLTPTLDSLDLNPTFILNTPLKTALALLQVLFTPPGKLIIIFLLHQVISILRRILAILVLHTLRRVYILLPFLMFVTTLITYSVRWRVAIIRHFVEDALQHVEFLPTFQAGVHQ